jgi:hypothetical protein
MMRLDQLPPLLNGIVIPGDIGKPIKCVTSTLLTTVVTLDAPTTIPMCVMARSFLDIG